jgi:hypothetical protein
VIGLRHFTIPAPTKKRYFSVATAAFALFFVLSEATVLYFSFLK